MQTQGTPAPRRKSVRGPPQEKTAPGTSTTPAATQRQISTTRPKAADLQTAKENVACAEAKYQMTLHEKLTQQEHVHKKQRVIVAETSEEEDEEHVPSSSGFDDSASDLGYKRDPREEEEDVDDNANWFDD